MEANNELRTAWDFIEHTGISVFLTGKAGTGKTTFLKAMKEHSRKRMIVVAPTGVAAINAGGVTIHSFFQIPPSIYIPGAQVKEQYKISSMKRHIMRTIDMVVIDEISMVRADLLDAVDSVLRRFRNPLQPFGGVQLVMIGDLQQLTPVVTGTEEPVLSRYYTTPYFFGSRALQQISYVTIQLTHVYRQQDDRFITILNHIRENRMTDEDFRMLNARYKPAFLPRPEEGYIRLTTHNRTADVINETELRKLPGARFVYQAEIKDKFPASDYPVEASLELKQGAQVMFARNDVNGEYYNGLIGRITHIDDENIEVECAGKPRPIKVEKQTWENTTYTLNPETHEIEPQVLGTFTQYPLRLAWAITIHKSQGLTFEHAIIDAGRSFAPGQVYVALSRCKTLEGMVLSTPISQTAIIHDQRVSAYIAGQQEAAEESIRQLPSLKEEYYCRQLLDLFDFQSLMSAEQMVYRHLLEFFRDYHRLTLLHGETIQQLEKELMQVAYKWQSQIRSMSIDQLHGQAFLDRVKRSTAYFHHLLVEKMGRLIEQTKDASSGNKEAMKRMNELYKNLWLLYLCKTKLLRRMEDEEFSVAGYLGARQETLLDAMDIVQPGSVSRTRKRKKGSDDPFDRKATATRPEARLSASQLSREAKTRQAAPPTAKSGQGRLSKEESGKVSLQLFEQGKSMEEIARVRRLSVSTVAGHLLPYVVSGQIELSKLIRPARQAIIREAMRQAGAQAKLSEIKQLCPENIEYVDIRLVVEYDKAKKEQK